MLRVLMKYTNILNILNGKEIHLLKRNKIKLRCNTMLQVYVSSTQNVQITLVLILCFNKANCCKDNMHSLISDILFTRFTSRSSVEHISKIQKLKVHIIKKYQFSPTFQKTLLRHKFPKYKINLKNIETLFLPMTVTGKKTLTSPE